MKETAIVDVHAWENSKLFLCVSECTAILLALGPMSLRSALDSTATLCMPVFLIVVLSLLSSSALVLARQQWNLLYLLRGLLQ